MVYVDLPSDIFIYDEYCNLKPRKDWVALKDNSLYNGGIENKRKAYVEQTKCLIGKLQGFMNAVKDSDKVSNTNIIIQGVSNIKELSDMQAGRYSNFVKDRLVNLAIRKGDKPKFLINANVCLASDFTKSMLRYQDYCYTIDNMKMPRDEMYSLKQNLINNSVIRGNKISNIAINYREWYADFENKNEDVIKKKKADEIKNEKLKLTIETMPIASKKVSLDDSSAAYYDLDAFNPDNIYTPTDEMVSVEIEEDNKEIEKNDENKEVKVDEQKLEVKTEVKSGVIEENNEVKVENVKVEATKTVNVEEKKEEVAEEPAPKEEEIIPEGFEPAEFSEDSQIDF